MNQEILDKIERVKYSLERWNYAIDHHSKDKTYQIGAYVSHWLPEKVCEESYDVASEVEDLIKLLETTNLPLD